MVPTMSDGRVRRAALVVAAAVLASGCAGMPTSGPVQQGRDLRLQQDNAAVPFIAEPPQPGATAADVVIGFLRACADFRDDHAVARQYLTPAARQQWDPGAGTVVYDRVEAAEPTDPAAVVVAATQVAQVDREGSYRRTAEGARVERRFEVERVRGEWRIAGLDDGLLLSTLDLRETYRQVALYFLSPARNTLVPDLVLLPQLPGLTTQVMSRLLQGPTTGLRGAVSTAFPQGTDLDVASVPVRDGLATVRLGEAALRADDPAREQMSAQIVWTLKQLGPEIARIRITAGGEDLVTSGVGAEQPRDSWGSFDPDGLARDPSLYVVRDATVGRLIDDGFGPVAGPAGSGDVALRTPAVALDASRLAAVGDDGTQVVVSRLAPDATLEVVAEGGDFARPSWDPSGDLWFVDRARGSLWLLPAGGTRPVAVRLPRLPGRVSAVAVSRDGARVALVVGAAGNARLVVAAVTGLELVDGDDTDEGAVALTGAHEPLPGLRGVRDLAWAAATTVVALGSRDGLPPQPVYVDIDGYGVVDVEPLDRMVSLAAAPPFLPQINPLVGGTSDGRVLQFTSGRGWVAVGEGADPAYPG